MNIVQTMILISFRCIMMSVILFHHDLVDNWLSLFFTRTGGFEAFFCSCNLTGSS